MRPDRSVWLHFGSVSHVLPFRTENEVKAWAADRERHVQAIGIGSLHPEIWLLIVVLEIGPGQMSV